MIHIWRQNSISLWCSLPWTLPDHIPIKSRGRLRKWATKDSSTLTLKRHCKPQGLDFLRITQIAGATVNGLGSVLGLLGGKRCAHSMHPMRCFTFANSSILILGSLCARCGASPRWTLAVCPCDTAWFFLHLQLGLRCAVLSDCPWVAEFPYFW